MEEVFLSTPADAKATPKVRPSAHLWHMTAKAIAKILDTSVSIPMDNPSNVAWIPIATYKRYGAHNFYCF